MTASSAWPWKIIVDGCITKAPGGGECAGRSPVDRGKQAMKRPSMTGGYGYDSQRTRDELTGHGMTGGSPIRAEGARPRRTALARRTRQRLPPGRPPSRATMITHLST
jgi:hypothetical protein